MTGTHAPLARATAVAIALAAGIASNVAHAAVAPMAGAARVQMAFVPHGRSLDLAVSLQSPLYLPLDGRLTVSVDGVPILARDVATASKVFMTVPLAMPRTAIFACTVFNGRVAVGSEDILPAEGLVCASFVPARLDMTAPLARTSIGVDEHPAAAAAPSPRRGPAPWKPRAFPR